jgi:two-component system, NarL family, sensor kinase
MPSSKTEVFLILILLTIFVVGMIAFVIMILFFIQKKQRGFTSDLNTVKENYDKELYKAQLEIQEQTLSEISREIHDNVGQLLSLVQLGLGNMDFDHKEMAMGTRDEIFGLLSRGVEELRLLSRSLNTDSVRDTGLKKAVEIQADFIRRTSKLEVDYQVTGTPAAVGGTREIILFRLLQEALNNILRHADASKVLILLAYEPDQLKLEISDNGKGFDLKRLSESGQMNGIHNMKHRAKLINAEFLISSQETGTTITVIAPNG